MAQGDMELMTIEQTSQETGWPIPTIREWIRKDKFCPSVRIGRRRYVRRADLNAWIDAQFAANEGGAA